MAPWDLRETLKSCNGGTLPDQSVEQFHRAWDQVLRGDHGVASWVQPHRSAYRVRVRNVILPDGEAAPKSGLSLGVHSTTEAAHEHLRDTMWMKLSCECPSSLPPCVDLLKRLLQRALFGQRHRQQRTKRQQPYQLLLVHLQHVYLLPKPHRRRRPPRCRLPTSL
ncbi:hypothetical protein AB1Y20_018842 [Prymnesium parvum]|uniref:Uncharacterized protein n=1 Tax=Prymnesium parvum TaxID=97485 RepID=A0AB34JPT7_PRYPA